MFSRLSIGWVLSDEMLPSLLSCPNELGHHHRWCDVLELQRMSEVRAYKKEPGKCNRFSKTCPSPQRVSRFSCAQFSSVLVFISWNFSFRYHLSCLEFLSRLGSFWAVLFAVCFKATVESFLPAHPKPMEFVTASKYLDVLRS